MNQQYIDFIGLYENIYPDGYCNHMIEEFERLFNSFGEKFFPYWLEYALLALSSNNHLVSCSVKQILDSKEG